MHLAQREQSRQSRAMEMIGSAGRVHRMPLAAVGEVSGWEMGIGNGSCIGYANGNILPPSGSQFCLPDVAWG